MRCWRVHRGRSVAVSYGSAAGELAACLNAVGIASCAELTKLELTAPGPNLDRVLDRAARRPAARRAASTTTRAVGWYRADDRRV